jgi:hypothetical protein
MYPTIKNQSDQRERANYALRLFNPDGLKDFGACLFPALKGGACGKAYVNPSPLVISVKHLKNMFVYVFWYNQK